AGDRNIFVGASRPLIGASPQIDEVANVEKARNRSGLRRLVGATRDRGRNRHNVGEAKIAARSRPVEPSGERAEDRRRVAFEAVVRRRRNQLAAPDSFRRAKVPDRPEGQKHRRRPTDVDVDAGRIDPDRLRDCAWREQKQKEEERLPVIHRRGAENAEEAQREGEALMVLLCVSSAFSAPLRRRLTVIYLLLL